MVNLVTPIIRGPLSDLSPQIQVSGCVAGATVEIRAVNRTTVVKADVLAGESWLSLLPGEVLIGGDQLVARQYRSDGSGDESDETPPDKATTVSTSPIGSVGLGPVDITGSLWECGEFVWVSGATPGSTVEVLWGSTANPKGQGIAHGEAARFRLNRKFPADETIQVRQRTPTGVGPVVNRQVQALPPGNEKQLRAPVIRPPALECQTAVLVEGVFEGAEVVITRKSGQEDRAGFDQASLWMNLSKPLASSDGWISARQEMLRCEREGIASTPILVDPAATPRTPLINTSLCVGSTRIQLAALEPGAEVWITNGSRTYKGTASPASVQDFEIQPILPGDVQVIQLLCGMKSAVAVAPVNPQPVSVPQPQIKGPLFRCARTVEVRDLHPGAEFEIWAKGAVLGVRPISPRMVAAMTEQTVNVSPFLFEGDEVWVWQWPCGLSAVASAPSPVLPLPQVESPVIVEPVTRLDTSVTVKRTLKGAVVEILRQRKDLVWEVIGTAWAAGKSTTVPISKPLSTGEDLRPRLRICELETNESPIATVVIPAPLAPILKYPPKGSLVPRGTEVTLIWEDPGAAQDRKADSFTVTVVGTTTTPLNPAVSGKSAKIPASQTTKYGATMTWTVTASNSTGSSSSISTFRIPPAPTPSLSARKEGTQIKCEGSGFAAGHTVEISVATYFSGLAGSPNNPVQEVDNRSGSATTLAKADGTIDVLLTPEDVLGPRTIIENGRSQSYKSAPFQNAAMTVRARNQPPISPGDGSSNWTSDVKFNWI